MAWAPNSFAARFSRAWSRPVIATRAPAAISACAIPCPIPELPPVTSAVALLRFMDDYARGTNARKLRGLSTVTRRMVASDTPAARSFGTNIVSVVP